jgi:hypothetical protein
MGTGSGGCHWPDGNKSVGNDTLATTPIRSLSQVGLDVAVIAGENESQSSRAGLEKQRQIQSNATFKQVFS